MTKEELKQYSDTRRYNLILCLGAGRLQGWFVPFGSYNTAPVKGVEATYIPEPEGSLSKIETAVYDNPILLEDYECRILLNTPHQLLFPQEAPTSLIEKAMNRFYGCRNTDVFTSTLGSAKIAFVLCNGLRPFLSRTFAGLKPMHRLEPLYRRFVADRSAPGRVRVYADLDEPYLHLLAFNGEKLLHASTHPVSDTSDAAYFIFALWQQLGLSSDDGQLNLSGSIKARRELMPLLRRHVNYVSLSLLPRLEGAEDVPTPVLLTYSK